MNIPLNHDCIVEASDQAVRPFAKAPSRLTALVFLGDMAVMAATAVAAVTWSGQSSAVVAVVGALGLALAFAAVASAVGLYRWETLLHPVPNASRIILAAAAACLAAVGFGAILGAPLALMGAQSALLAVLGAGLALIVRVALTRVRSAAPRRGAGRNVALIGEHARMVDFSNALSGACRAAVVRAFPTDFVGGGRSELAGLVSRGGVDALMRFARDHRVDVVVVAVSCPEKAGAITATLRELPVDVHLCGPLAANSGVAREDLFGAPTVRVVRRPISDVGAALKSLVDYTLACIALLALAPLLGMIAVAIKLDSPGPVFFMQERLGLNNRRFRIYKFRSMRHDPASGKAGVVRQATRDDDRITRVGRIIRSTSLDELPQLLNVLDGTMSLVGPRPHALSHNDEYGRLISGYYARHRVKPGITGWAQVQGLRGETRDLSLMEARVRHDIHYADNWSLLLDLRIIALTAMVVLFQKTAY